MPTSYTIPEGMKALDDDKTMLQAVRLMEAADVCVALYDDQDRLRYANRAFRAAWFIEEGEHPLWSELMRRNFHARRGTVIKVENFEAWLASTISRRGKAGFRAFETDLHDGRWLWMTETTQDDGWMLCVASDITSSRPDERALRQDRDDAIKASHTDELTGIPSRRFVMAKLNDLLAMRDEGNVNGLHWGPVGCIAVLDIDNFKYINDRFGHSVGDAVLKDFAATLQSYVRKTDVLGRVGGEEFVLILPNTTAENAEVIVGRMLEAVRLSRPLPDQVSFRYTFSAGIACAERNEKADDLYRRADLALYAAKMRGRNQISLDTAARVG
ncbi:GGDEF domain-containing protein [Aliirhizobium cellulosilyticum]|uniref:diguanylate cyclase n=1 Tax=Aliirhizobium cellulosilyticum TaxID=393664 RepID=A0A7W6TDD6_9HYPH|nr:diguanylate cyclase (GGDEF)-like protein [Rhizobium cellulosilyticum]MBB4411422.1 diguanylate cyclase (GGDEF)-like protein [Rhizobium cellulosilyticum]MBB4446111.1 diguanylate cyclase (GGDEF)-like protein [Rhizobium cellulosilyticum]